MASLSLPEAATVGSREFSADPVFGRLPSSRWDCPISVEDFGWSMPSLPRAGFFVLLGLLCAGDLKEPDREAVLGDFRRTNLAIFALPTFTRWSNSSFGADARFFDLLVFGEGPISLWFRRSAISRFSSGLGI